MLSFQVAAASLLVSPWLARALPAGGPQGIVTYPIGTIMEIAVLQPIGNDFMVSTYHAITFDFENVFLLTWLTRL